MPRHLQVPGTLRPDLEAEIRVAIDDACLIFQELYTLPVPAFLVQLFAEVSDDEICWSEVKQRPLRLGSVSIYELKPLLRINLALFLPSVPVEIVYSTLLEELVHLHRGFGLVNPHDAVFRRMVRQYKFFADSELWKLWNAYDVVQEMKQNPRFWSEQPV